MAFKNSWSHYWEIDINANTVISGVVGDWPCLITELHIPSNAFDIMQSNGEDLRFSSDSDGDTELYYDLVRIDTVNKTAHIYIRIPLLSSLNATTIYGWIGNDSVVGHTQTWMENTYNSDIAAWWPMEEGSGPTVGDRTGNGHDGTISNAVWVELADGWVLEFDNANPGLIEYGAIAEYDETSDSLAMLSRFTPKKYDDNAYSRMLSSDDVMRLGVNHASWVRRVRAVFNDEWTSNISYDYGDYAVPYTAGAVYNRSTTEALLYVDGVERGSYFGPTMSNSIDSIDPLTTFYHEGYIHANALIVRAVSADEIAIHHLMLSDPATFATAGALEANISYNADSLLQTQNDIIHSSDIDLKENDIDINYNAHIVVFQENNPIYNTDTYIRESRYSLADTLARKILDLNSNNKVNIIGFNTEYIEVILNTQASSTTTIGENATSHTLQIEATVNILDKTTVNDDHAERSAVPDGTEVKFEIDNVSTSSAMLNPTVAETNGGKAETSLVVITPIGTDKIDVTVRAYLNQF